MIGRDEQAIGDIELWIQLCRLLQFGHGLLRAILGEKDFREEETGGRGICVFRKELFLDAAQSGVELLVGEIHFHQLLDRAGILRFDFGGASKGGAGFGVFALFAEEDAEEVVRLRPVGNGLNLLTEESGRILEPPGIMVGVCEQTGGLDRGGRSLDQLFQRPEWRFGVFPNEYRVRRGEGPLQ